MVHFSLTGQTLHVLPHLGSNLVQIASLGLPVLLILAHGVHRLHHKRGWAVLGVGLTVRSSQSATAGISLSNGFGAHEVLDGVREVHIAQLI